MSGKSIFIFRRDFRLNDNLGLNQLLKSTKTKIIPLFILDPNQLGEFNVKSDIKPNINKFDKFIEKPKPGKKIIKNMKDHVSFKAIKFMFESLIFLDRELQLVGSKLHIAYGEPADVIQKIAKTMKITFVAFNADYSPYSIERDNKIKLMCQNLGIKTLITDWDILLYPINEKTSMDKMKVFGKYYKYASKIPISKPITLTLNNRFAKIKATSDIFSVKISDINNALLVDGKISKITMLSGGRLIALKLLKRAAKLNYERTRMNSNQYTTLLSTHLKFGTISVREFYWKITNEVIRRQLYWRNYYFLRTFTRVEKLGYDHYKMHFEYALLNNIKWNNSSERYWALWEGRTGFPIIDACVRQLNDLGWMHNRGRLAVACFAIKILHLSPESCQIAFSKRLIDGCYAQNVGNWAWVAGYWDPSGFRYGKVNTMSGRMFREAINPRKIDPNLRLIRRYIPELAKIPDQFVATWHTSYIKYPKLKYKPIIDFETQVAKWYIMTSKS